MGLWVRREWRRSWPALVALGLLVAVAGAVTTAFAAGARRADGAYERFQAETGAPNLIGQARLAELDLTSTGPSALTRQVEAIDELLAIPGVERVVARAWWAVELEPSTDAGRPVAFATGIFQQAGSVFASLVVDGHLPAEDDATGVTIDEEAVRVLGSAVGSRLNMRTGVERTHDRVGVQRRDGRRPVLVRRPCPLTSWSPVWCGTRTTSSRSGSRRSRSRKGLPGSPG